MGIFDFLKGRNAESTDSNSGYKGYTGATELFLKAYEGDVAGVVSLLAQGKDPNERSFVNYPESEIITPVRRNQELVRQYQDMGSAVFDEIFGPDKPKEAMALMFHRIKEKRDNPGIYHHMELGITTLFFPIVHGDVDIVKALIDAGANPNAMIFNGCFPLLLAAEEGSLPIVKMLIESGAEIDKETPSGYTALRRAVEARRADVAAFLIANGANINSWTYDGRSILEAAISQLDASVAGMIFYHSSFSVDDEKPIFSTNSSMESALIQVFSTAIASVEMDDLYAALGSKYMNDLWNKNAVASVKGEELDESEIGEHRASVGRELLAACSGLYGEEVSDMLHGDPIVHEASYIDEPLPMYFAVRRSVDPVFNRNAENTAIHKFFYQLIKNYYLLKAIDKRDAELLETALGAGADPNSASSYNNKWWVPIVATCKTNNFDMCERLLKAGADTNKQQPDSETALSTASMIGNVELVNLLLDNGANPNAISKSGSPLSLAKNIAIIFALFEEGANPNITDDDGITPIMRFVKQQRREAVGAMLLCGADIHLTNNDGKTAIDLAKSLGDEGIIRILLDKFAYDAPYPEVQLGKNRSCLVERIIDLTLLKHPLDSFVLSEPDATSSWANNETRKAIIAAANSEAAKAQAAKESGDLISANHLYAKASVLDDVFIAENIWGWFQVLLLAKNFRDALLVLRYYHSVVASHHALLKAAGKLDSTSSDAGKSLLNQGFVSFNVLVERMGIWPRFKSSVQKKIREYGGSDCWKSFSLTDDEFDQFIRYFINRDNYQIQFASPDDVQQTVLEEAIQLQETKAYAALGREFIDIDNAKAIELCQEGLNAGDFGLAPFVLALLLKHSNPDKSADLFEFLAKYKWDAIAAQELVNLVKTDDPERAIPYLEQLVEMGDVPSYAELARIVSERDSQYAIELCEKAIELGDADDAPFFLAYLLEDVDPNRAKELYQSCIDRGFVYGAANNLARLIKEEEPERAIELYQLSIAAGNTYAAKCLADLLWDSNPERAKELYQIAIDGGDEYNSTFSLAVLTEDEDPEQAKRLYERSIAAGDRYASPEYLAKLLEKSEPKKAADLYRIAIEEGNTHACIQLAWLIFESDRNSAIELCNMALDADKDVDAEFLLAFLLMRDEPARSKELYEHCLAEGAYLENASYNLANLISQDDPQRAIELYELAIDQGNVLAYSQLARLVNKSDRSRAVELCEKAVELGDVNDAPFYLAWLLEKEDPERSKGLYETCIENGNVLNAANNLANLIKDDDPVRAKELFEASLEAGNAYYAAANLAKMLGSSDQQRAAELYQESIDAGNVLAYTHLARLVSETDRSRAVELCEKAVELGDVNDAPFYLAWLLEKEDPERSKGLYETCIENGNVLNAANNLANLIKDDDPVRAKELFEASLESGNAYYAAINLAEMLRSDDPERAINLYNMAIDSGNVFGYVNLAILIAKDDKKRAIELCEQAIEKGVTIGAPLFLATLLEDQDPTRSRELYQFCIDSGNDLDAAYHYANFIKDDDPEKTVQLYLQSADAGNMVALNEAAVLLMKQSPERAIVLLKRAIANGEKEYAPCNLAHILAPKEPDEAELLYKLSLENEHEENLTESLIGLSLLLESKSPEESKTYRDNAIERSNLRLSLDFMLDYYDSADIGYACRIRKFGKENAMLV